MSDNENNNDNMEEENNNGFDVSKTLEKYKNKFLPITVDKPDDLYYDLGCLYCYDRHPVEKKNEDLEKLLKDTARDNAQLLFNRIFELQTKRIDASTVLAILPKPCLPLPREKPLPKEKPLTKWEKFAKQKGITKTKRSKLVWDEEKKDYLPRWGYRRANNEVDEWVIEDRPSERGDHEDPFLKRKVDKRERIENQNKRQQANQKAATKESAGKLDPYLSGGLSGDERRKKDKMEIQQTLSKTRGSTASMGKFDPLLPHEKKPQRSKPQQKQPVARSNFKEEKDKNLVLLDRVLNKQANPEPKEPKVKTPRKTANRKKPNKPGFKGEFFFIP